jgi:hypothetical protein
MIHVIATDEAGYGPNLGPLVISGTVWRVERASPDNRPPLDFPALAREFAPIGDSPDSRVTLFGDSKRLYSPGGGLAALERGVLASLRLVDAVPPPTAWPTSWRSLLARCDPSCAGWLAEVPWYATFDCPLPIDLTSAEVAPATAQLRAALGLTGTDLVAVESRIVCAQSFNCGVARWGNKATALSLWTLELVARLTAHAGDGPLLIACDKHGGRNRYGALLQQQFPDYLIEIVRESRECSVYRWGPAEGRVEVRFMARGEQFVPTALASMISKYLRELAMLAFNAYWTTRVPGLRPTAGYPADARRFHEQIREAQQRQKISDTCLWRKR